MNVPPTLSSLPARYARGNATALKLLFVAVLVLLLLAPLRIFYLGLLSLLEFVGFTIAYASAAGISLLTVRLYSRSVLRSGPRALLVSGMLGGVYGYLYFVLRMEDFSLLAGTAALFALLAAVMFATRRMEQKCDDDVAGAATEVAS